MGTMMLWGRGIGPEGIRKMDDWPKSNSNPLKTTLALKTR
jgi:hypothetical protein